MSGTEIEQERKATQIMRNSMLSEMERLIGQKQGDQQKYAMKKDSYLMLQEDFKQIEQKYLNEVSQVNHLRDRMENLETCLEKQIKEKKFIHLKLQSFQRKDRQFLNSLGNTHKNLNVASGGSSSLFVKHQKTQAALLQVNQEREIIWSKCKKMQKQLQQLAPELSKSKKILEINSEAYKNCLAKYQKIVEEKKVQKLEIQNLKNLVRTTGEEKLMLLQENTLLKETINQSFDNPNNSIQAAQKITQMKSNYERQITELQQKLLLNVENSKQLEDSYKEKIEIFQSRIKFLEEGQRAVLIQKIDRLTSTYEEGKRTSQAKDIIYQILKRLPSLESKILQVSENNDSQQQLEQQSEPGQKVESEHFLKNNQQVDKLERQELSYKLSKLAKELQLIQLSEQRQVERNRHLEKQNTALALKVTKLSKQIGCAHGDLQKAKIEIQKVNLKNELIMSNNSELQKENKALKREKEQLQAISSAHNRAIREAHAMADTQALNKLKKYSENFRVFSIQQQNKQILDELLVLKIKDENNRAVITSLRKKLKSQVQHQNKVAFKLEELRILLKEEDQSFEEYKSHLLTLQSLHAYLKNFTGPQLEYKTELEKKESECSKMKSILKEQQGNFEELLEAHQDLIDKIEEKSRIQDQENQKSLNEIKEKLVGLKESEQKFEQQKQKIVGELSEQNLKLLEELDSSKKQIQDLVEKNTDLEQKLSKLNQKLTLVSATAMKRQMKGNEEEIKTLMKQMEELKESMALQEENNKLLSQKHKDVEQNLKKSQQDYGVLKVKSAQNEKDMKDKIQNLEKEIETYCSTIEQFNEGRQDPMAKLVQMFKEKEKQNQAIFRELQEEYQTYKDSKIQELKEESQQSQEQGNIQEVESLSIEMEKLKQQNREIERQNLVLKKQVSYFAKGGSSDDGQISVQIRKLLGIVNRARRLNEAYQDILSKKKSLLQRRSGIELEDSEVEPEKKKRLKVD